MPAAPSSRPRWTHPALAVMLIAVAVFAVYSPTLNGQFLWDDNALVRGNLLIRSPLFCLEAFRHTLFDNNSNFYRPVQTLTFIFDYWAWGLNPYGYHLTNILLHVLNGSLLCLVLRRLLPHLFGRTVTTPADGAAAFGVALVWAVHPVHSAAIAYVSGRADTLAMGGCLLAWLGCEAAFSAAHAGRRALAAAAALAFFTGGLCSKEIAFVWLALFLGYVFGVRRSLPRRAQWTVVAGGLVAMGVYWWLRSLPPAPPPHPPYPPLPSRWLLMIRALGDYASLMVFPQRLFMERQVFAAPGLSSPEDQSVYVALGAAGAVALAGLIGGAFVPGRGRALRAFGAAWFLAAFLPISNLFTLNASVAEHWLYLPSIGFLLFLAGVAADLSWGGLKLTVRAAAPAALLFALALSVRTYWRSFDWMDELTFFRQTIADGGDVPRARLGLANSFSHQQNDAAAIPVLRHIAAEYPRVISARINLANALGRSGQFDEARVILERAVGDLFAGNDPHVITATISSLDQLENNSAAWLEKRRALLAEATRRFPDAWEIVQKRRQDATAAGDPAEALAVVKDYADAHWWHAPAHLTLGDLYSVQRRGPEALAAWLQAARLDVHDTEAFASAAGACAQDGRLDEACEYQRRAVRRLPASPKLHALYAQWLTQRGDASAGAAEYAEANRLLAQGRAQVDNH